MLSKRQNSGLIQAFRWGEVVMSYARTYRRASAVALVALALGLALLPGARADEPCTTPSGSKFLSPSLGTLRIFFNSMADLYTVCDVRFNRNVTLKPYGGQAGDRVKVVTAGS